MALIVNATNGAPGVFKVKSPLPTSVRSPTPRPSADGTLAVKTNEPSSRRPDRFPRNHSFRRHRPLQRALLDHRQHAVAVGSGQGQRAAAGFGQIALAADGAAVGLDYRELAKINPPLLTISPATEPFCACRRRVEAYRRRSWCRRCRYSCR